MNNEMTAPRTAKPSKRARLEALLFNDAKPGMALSTPKLPPMAGEP